MNNERAISIGEKLLQEARKKLGASPDDNFTTVRSKFRELAKSYHPDKGGNVDMMSGLSDAYNLLKGYFEHKYSVSLSSSSTCADSPIEISFADLSTHYSDIPTELEEKQEEKTFFYDGAHFYTTLRAQSHVSPTHNNRSPRSEINFRNYAHFLVEEDRTRIAHHARLGSVFQDRNSLLQSVFPEDGARPETQTLSIQLFDKVASLDDARKRLLYVKFLPPLGGVSFDPLFSLASALFEAPSIGQMIECGAYCKSFLCSNLSIDLLPGQSHFIQKNNALYAEIFINMFRLFIAEGGVRETALHSLENGLLTAQGFMRNTKGMTEDEVRYEIGTIFNMLFQKDVPLSQTTEMLGDVKTIMAHATPWVKHEYAEKLSPVFSYVCKNLIRQKGYTSDEAKNFISGIAHIQSNGSTQLRELSFARWLIPFAQKLEKRVTPQDCAVRDDRSPFFSTFITSLIQGSRGYMDFRYEKATQEWMDAFDQSFAAFKSHEELFNKTTQVFSELSKNKENERLKFFNGVRIPLISAAIGATKMIELFEKQYGHNSEKKTEAVARLSQIFTRMREEEYYQRTKKNKTIVLTDREKEMYKFLNQLMARPQRKRFLFPNDIDQLIVVYTRGLEGI